MMMLSPCLLRKTQFYLFLPKFGINLWRHYDIMMECGMDCGKLPQCWMMIEQLSILPFIQSELVVAASYDTL